MPRVMRHLSGGVEAFVLTRNEHPPPHVHIEHAAEWWEIKVCFSYVEDFPTTYKVLPVSMKLPPLAVMNSLVAQVRASRQECRKVWSQHVGDLGLTNQYVAVDIAGLASQSVLNAPGSFLVKSAVYDCRTNIVTFNRNIEGQCP